MLPDDGDLVRGLGYITMFSAWLEEDIDDILRQMAPVQDFGEQIQRFPISRKLRHAADLVRLLKSDELGDLAAGLDQVAELFEDRNEFVHGRIYANPEQGTLLQSGRQGIPTRQVTSGEAYDLANEIWGSRAVFIGPQVIRLPRAVNEYLERQKA